MSVENLKRFGAMVEKDPAPKSKVVAAGTDFAKIIALGKENGCEFSVDDIRQLYEAGIKDELTEEQLAGVAGGGFIESIVNIVKKVADIVTKTVSPVAKPPDSTPTNGLAQVVKQQSVGVLVKRGVTG